MPRVSFFASRAEHAIWSGDFKKESMNSSADALPHVYARGIVEGQLRDDENLRFINTNHTARDMLRIVQAHGLEKNQYWGFSYVFLIALKPRVMLKARQLWKCLESHVRINVSGMSFCFETFEHARLSFVGQCRSAGY
jgi:hypothetical protein